MYLYIYIHLDRFGFPIPIHSIPRWRTKNLICTSGMHLHVIAFKYNSSSCDFACFTRKLFKLLVDLAMSYEFDECEIDWGDAEATDVGDIATHDAANTSKLKLPDNYHYPWRVDQRERKRRKVLNAMPEWWAEWVKVWEGIPEDDPLDE